MLAEKVQGMFPILAKNIYYWKNNNNALQGTEITDETNPQQWLEGLIAQAFELVEDKRRVKIKENQNKKRKESQIEVLTRLTHQIRLIPLIF